MWWPRIQVCLRGKSGRWADAAEGPTLTDAVEKGLVKTGEQ